jgi:hypothetical protein
MPVVGEFPGRFFMSVPRSPVVLPSIESPVVVLLPAGPPACELPPAEFPVCARADVLPSARAAIIAIALTFMVSSLLPSETWQSRYPEIVPMILWPPIGAHELESAFCPAAPSNAQIQSTPLMPRTTARSSAKVETSQTSEPPRTRWGLWARAGKRRNGTKRRSIIQHIGARTAQTGRHDQAPRAEGRQSTAASRGRAPRPR